jgi:parallel beta-helix repeat protein
MFLEISAPEHPVSLAEEEETAMFRMFCKVLILALVVGAVLPVFAAEGRTPIWRPLNAATVGPLTASGKYVVTRDIIRPVCFGPVIDIAVPAVLPTQPPGHVDIDLNGFTLFACPGHPVIRAVGQNNITIRNGTLGYADYGVEIVGTPEANTKVVIEDVKVLDVVIAGIQLDQVSDFALRRNNVVTTDFLFDLVGQGQVGIRVLGPDAHGRPVKGTIEDNQIERCGGGIEVKGASSVAILNNRLENLNIVAPAPAQGAIVYDLSDDGLIANNTIESISEGGSGIYLGDASGCKIYNNVVRWAEGDGIAIAGFSDDNLILDNVVSQSGRDGVRVEGSRNHVERNVLNSNCQNGSQACWGLHFVRAFNGADSVYRGNTARVNLGVAGTCPWPGAPALPPTTDFCDEQIAGPAGTGTTSIGDNFMPTLF